ncbi:uncharacterized protein [Leptinotarsa decemlineata]|uniref:uncharacterized protein n=1 Tax=Leptinotarsa decemlineata TaxID=7539 RepID=UPI003D308975
MGMLIWETSILFLMAKELDFFQQNFLLFLCGQGVLAFNIMNIYVLNSKRCIEISKLFENYGLPWDAAGEEIHQLILQDIKKLKLIINILLMSMSIVHVTFLPFPDICQPFHKIAQEYFTKWTWLVDLTNIVALFLCGYNSSCFVCKITYSLRHLRIQIQLLNRLLNNINTRSRGDLKDEKYQMLLHEKLVYFMEAHQNTKKIYKTLSKRFGWILYPILITSCFTGVAIIHKSLQRFEATGIMLQPREVFAYSLFGFNGYFLFDLGEQISRESQKLLSNIYNCPWYRWNRKNKQVVLLFMTNCLEPMVFSFYGLMKLEYSNSTKMAKICWSLLNILRNINNRNG